MRIQKAASGFACPHCAAAMRVIRTTPRTGSILRRRRCPKCSFALTTSEREVGKGQETAISALERISVGQLLRAGSFADFFASAPVTFELGEKRNGPDSRKSARNQS